MPRLLTSPRATSLGLLLARLPLGLMMLVAGVYKVHDVGVGTFVERSSKDIPSWLPHLFGDMYLHILPFMEIVVGAMLILGLLTRLSALVVMLMILSYIIARTGWMNGVTGTLDANVVLIGLAVLLVITGSGDFGIDEFIRGHAGPGKGR